jgi:hypothetical protein
MGNAAIRNGRNWVPPTSAPYRHVCSLTCGWRPLNWAFGPGLGGALPNEQRRPYAVSRWLQLVARQPCELHIREALGWSVMTKHL